jgi:hypothetical protein
LFVIATQQGARIAMGYGLDGWGSIPGRGKNLSFLHSVQTGPEVHPNSYPVGIGGSLPKGKTAELEDVYSVLCSVEVKIGYAVPPLPQISS